MDHRHVDALELPALVELLDDLEGKRTPVGWSPDDAVIKAAVERRILEVVRDAAPTSAPPPGLACALAVRIQTKQDLVEGTVVDLHRGGMFVETALDVPRGTHIHLVVLGRSDARGLRARGQVAWLATGTQPGVGISVAAQPTPAHERRLKRFVMELLAHRTDT